MNNDLVEHIPAKGKSDPQLGKAQDWLREGTGKVHCVLGVSIYRHHQSHIPVISTTPLYGYQISIQIILKLVIVWTAIPTIKISSYSIHNFLKYEVHSWLSQAVQHCYNGNVSFL